MANGDVLLLMVDHIGSGGAEKALKRLSDQVCDEFKDIYMTSNYPADINFDFGSAKYIPTNIVERPGLLGKIITFLIYFYCIFNIKRKYKITHSISFLERSNIVNIVTSFFFVKIKTIVSVRNNLKTQYDKFDVISKFIIRLALSICYRISFKVVCLSKSIESDLKSYLFFGCSSSTIYNGYDFRKIDFSDDRKCKSLVSENQKIRFIAIGRLSEQKGLDVLISSISRSEEFKSCATLDIYGDGEDKDYLEKLIVDLNLSDIVKIRKPVSDILSKFVDYDAFVFPSRWEGFGNALLEAISNKIPIVSSDCHHGPAEMLGFNTGIVESDALRVPVGYLYRDPMSDPKPILSCMLAIDVMIKELKEGFSVDNEFVEKFKLRFSESNSRSKWIALLNGESINE